MPKTLNIPPVISQEYEHVSVDRIRPHPRNVNQGDKGKIYQSITDNGFFGACIVQRSTSYILVGSHRWDSAREAGMPAVPVLWADVDDDAALRIMTADNATARAGNDNPLALAELLTELAGTDKGLAGTGFDGDDLDTLLSDLANAGDPFADPAGAVNNGPPVGPEQARRTLAERFGVPPFSVLDARQGYWQERKRAWLSLGIQSELGRGGAFQFPDDHIGPDGKFHAADLHSGYRRNAEGRTIRPHESARGNGLLGFSEQARSHYNATPGGAPLPAARLGSDGKTVRGDGRGRALSPGRNSGQDLMRGEHVVGQAHTAATAQLMEMAGGESASHQSGTSIFDPVLCELAYRWFCPTGGRVLDPFAGGSVRGVVASRLGLDYTGIELRAEQVAANEEQAKTLCPDAPPRWIVGDSRDAVSLLDAGGECPKVDFVFSCPPYADLEVYSDDPADLSTMPYPAFLEAYKAIVAASLSLLRPNRFACFVVGDVRDKKGFYRNFVGDTVNAFQEAGATLYNEAILVTAVGSLPIRVGKQFGSYRKLGKTHQNVLVFYKGDPARIPEVLGEVEYDPALFSDAEEADAGDPAADFGEVL